LLDCCDVGWELITIAGFAVAEGKAGAFEGACAHAGTAKARHAIVQKKTSLSIRDASPTGRLRPSISEC